MPQQNRQSKEEYVIDKDTKFQTYIFQQYSIIIQARSSTNFEVIPDSQDFSNTVLIITTKLCKKKDIIISKSVRL
jgi:hypothetical protein